MSSQLDYSFFLFETDNLAAPVSFKYYKARLIMRSAMVGKVITFSYLFDEAFTLSEELCVLLNIKAPV